MTVRGAAAILSAGPLVGPCPSAPERTGLTWRAFIIGLVAAQQYYEGAGEGGVSGIVRTVTRGAVPGF